VKGEICNPVIYFSMTIATNEEPEDLLVRISHEWHRRRGIVLKVKELQSFESEAILCLFNVFTSTPKQTVLAELCDILSKAQDLAQEMDPMEFFWDAADIPTSSKLPMLELCLSKLPSESESLSLNIE
jgi:hypothetical protein